MGYILRAFVGRPAALAPLVRASAHTTVVELAQGFHLIPLTDELFDDLNKHQQGPAILPWSSLTAPFETRLLALIGPAAVGYLEAEYFGGDGGQAAICWQNGQRQLASSTNFCAINAVLARLGVVANLAQQDEFEAVGLARHRYTDDWLTQ